MEQSTQSPDSFVHFVEPLEGKPMENFLFTFGDNCNVDRDGWITITAPTMIDARTAMWKLHGSKWAFCYKEEELKREYFPSGELAYFAYVPTEPNSVPVLLMKVPGYSPLTNDYKSREVTP